MHLRSAATTSDLCLFIAEAFASLKSAAGVCVDRSLSIYFIFLIKMYSATRASTLFGDAFALRDRARVHSGAAIAAETYGGLFLFSFLFQIPLLN